MPSVTSATTSSIGKLANIVIILMFMVSAFQLRADGRIALKQILLRSAFNTEFVASLKELGEIISINHRFADGSTLLHLAARHGEDFVVEHLLQRGASHSLTDDRGKTAYDDAVRLAQTRSAALLLSKMKGVNGLDTWGRSPINLATRDTGDEDKLLTNGYLIATKLMLNGGDAGLGKVEDGELRYLRSLTHASDETLRAALLTNANIIAYFTAAEDLDNLRRALRLLPENFDSQPLRDRALIISASHQDTAAFDLLIAHGADTSVQDNEFGLTPLMVAINNHNGQIVDALLLKYKVDPNIQDQFGNTALHHACTDNRCISFVRTLLAVQADPLLVNNRRVAPLVLAVMASKHATADVILAAMPDLKILKKKVIHYDGTKVSGVNIILNAIETSGDFQRVFADVADELEYLRSNAFIRLFQRKDPPTSNGRMLLSSE
ncbi:MAG: ankyrin repeat domain-containing protein [Pseudomonadota bacterium]|nr:ankyrin repeat domain-containing protein [Pseudomonadota bacterium]